MGIHCLFSKSWHLPQDPEHVGSGTLLARKQRPLLPHLIVAFLRCSIRPKLVTFVWNGSEVTTKTKLRNNGVIKAFSVYFAKPTIEFQVNGDAADFAPDRISARLRSCVPASEFRFGVYDRDAQADDYIAQLAAIGITDAKAAEEAARAAHAGAGRE